MIEKIKKNILPIGVVFICFLVVLAVMLSFTSTNKVEEEYFEPEKMSFEELMNDDSEGSFLFNEDSTVEIEDNRTITEKYIDSINSIKKPKENVYKQGGSSSVALIQKKIKEMEKEQIKVIPKRTQIKSIAKESLETTPIKKELTFAEKLILSRQNNSVSPAEKTFVKPLEFLAVINGNQTAYNNAMITVRVLSDVSYENKVLERNTYLYGVAKIIKTGRVKISFSSMTQKGKRIPISLTAYDQLDGYEGLIINDEAVLSELKNETNEEINSEVSTQGKIGRVLSSVLRKKKREIKIYLYDEHTIILKGHL